MKTRHHCELSHVQISSALRSWYASKVGAFLLNDIKAQLDLLLPQIFGFYALQIGCSIDMLTSSRIKRRIKLDFDTRDVNLLASPDYLPFQEDSLDLILLMHSLDFAEDPHRILREVDRTLIPEGYVLIVGFNPASLYGVWKLFKQRKNSVPWCGRFYTSARLRDWLSLLGFDTLVSNTLGFRPPIQHTGLQQRLVFVERTGVKFAPYLGGIHVILAQKKVATLTPLRRRWFPRRSLLAGNLTEPSTRESTHDQAC